MTSVFHSGRIRAIDFLVLANLQRTPGSVRNDETLARPHTNPEEVLFLSGNGHPAFEPEDINLNYPDWKARTFSMTDPDPDRRNAVADLLGRRRWTVLSPGAAPVTGTARYRARLEGVAGGDAHK